jgi:hypothetical protein
LAVKNCGQKHRFICVARGENRHLWDCVSGLEPPQPWAGTHHPPPLLRGEQEPEEPPRPPLLRGEQEWEEPPQSWAGTHHPPPLLRGEQEWEGTPPPPQRNGGAE